MILPILGVYAAIGFGIYVKEMILRKDSQATPSQHVKAAAVITTLWPVLVLTKP